MIVTTVVCLFVVVAVKSKAIDGINNELDKYKYKHVTETVNKYNVGEEKSTDYWLQQGKEAIYKMAELRLITNTAKNLILFLGDGMSIPTITAARIYLGQLNGTAGENTKLSFETFPHIGLAKTYCVNKQVADSACSATAYLCGVKASYGTLGVNANVQRGDCILSKDPNNRVSSIVKWAQDAGKGTGIVTTTRITNASPAGNYVHTGERDFESDYDIHVSKHPEASYCTDNAKQMVLNDPGKNVKVFLGGGRMKLLPNTTTDHEYPSKYGERMDGVDLIKEWERLKRQMNVTFKYVWNKDQLLNTDHSKTEYLMGLFERDDMKYHLQANENTEPTLEEMTRVAIKRLQNEANGYFLFVEGGLIDKAHHQNWARRALDETVEFHKAIQAAVEMTDIQDTLILVTSDHSHTMSFNGYAERGGDILGVDLLSDIDDSITYPALSYSNGPSAEISYRNNFTTSDLSNDTFRYPSLFLRKDESHGGDDVAIFARGPWSHLFRSTMEQNVIPLAMGFAAGIGPAAAEHPAVLTSSAQSLTGFTLVVPLVIVYLSWVKGI